jgi:competence protein ComEC
LRWLGAMLFLPLLLSRPQAPNAGQLWVTAFDVGQGTAVLLETAQHRILYDAGPMYSAASDSGSRVILPYLRSRGIDTLDSLMISHRDSDHVGGALTVMQGLVVKEVNSSLEPGHPVLRVAQRHQPCSAGQKWQWDGVTFEILHPSMSSYSVPEIKSNARSCTLKVSAAHGSILLTGDIEAAQEKELLKHSRASLASTVLVAPHHGSGTSSTPDFLQAVNPSLALFQVGNRNRYHHPKPEVFERYRQLGIARLRTDWSGAIQLRFENQLQVLPYREVHRRYWYRRALE